MDSTRLPGKALADLGGRPMLARVIDRLRLVEADAPIVVATSDRVVDDPIEDLANQEGVEVFRGDGEDVAGRAIACCDSHALNSFVRISGDSPFIPPELVDQLIDVSHNQDADLVTNLYPRSWPPGASVEVVKADALRRAYENMSSEEREHVTNYFYVTSEDWYIINIPAGDSRFKGVRLTVDTSAELKWARKLCTRLGPDARTATLDEVVRVSRDMLKVA